MTTQNKSLQSNFISEDCNVFLNDSQFLNNSPINKKQPKRKQTDVGDNDAFVSKTKPNFVKKNKIIGCVENSGVSQQKTLNVMSSQIESRKQINEKFLKNLSDIIMNFEADYNVLKENEEKLEYLTKKFLKCIQQSTTAYKQKLNSFKEIYAIYKKKYEELGTEQKSEVHKLGTELEEDIYKLKQTLISEAKANQRKNLQSFFKEIMENSND